jgi:hypothetical protein
MPAVSSYCKYPYACPQVAANSSVSGQYFQGGAKVHVSKPSPTSTSSAEEVKTDNNEAVVEMATMETAETSCEI